MALCTTQRIDTPQPTGFYANETNWREIKQTLATRIGGKWSANRGKMVAGYWRFTTRISERFLMHVSCANGRWQVCVNLEYGSISRLRKEDFHRAANYEAAIELAKQLATEDHE